MPTIFSTIISKFREPSQHKALTIDQRIIIPDPIIYPCLVIIKKNDFHLTEGISSFHAKSLEHFAFLRKRIYPLLNKHL